MSGPFLRNRRLRIGLALSFLLGSAALLVWGSLGAPRRADISLDRAIERDVTRLLGEIAAWRRRLEEALDELVPLAASEHPPLESKVLAARLEEWPAEASIEQWRHGFPVAWAGRAPEATRFPATGLLRRGPAWRWVTVRSVDQGTELRAELPLRSLWTDLHPLASVDAALDDIDSRLEALGSWWISDTESSAGGVAARPIPGTDPVRFLHFETPGPTVLEREHLLERWSWRRDRWSLAALLLWIGILLLLEGRRSSARWIGGLVATLGLRVAWAHLGTGFLPWPAGALDEQLLGARPVSDSLLGLLARTLGWEHWLATPADFWITGLLFAVFGWLTFRYLSGSRSIGWVLLAPLGFLIALLAPSCLQSFITIAVLESQVDLFLPYVDATLAPRVLLLTGLFAVGFGLAALLAGLLTAGASGDARRPRWPVLAGVLLGGIGGIWLPSSSRLVLPVVGLIAWGVTLSWPTLRRGGVVLPAAAILGTLALYPGLETARDLDLRRRVAELASTHPNPEDAFHDALEALVTNGLTSPAVQRVVERGGTDDEIAFAIWATSPFGREGWPARVYWAGPGGVTGTFEIGLPPSGKRSRNDPIEQPWPAAGAPPQIREDNWVDPTGRGWWMARHSGEDHLVEVHAFFSRRPTPFGREGTVGSSEPEIRLAVLGGQGDPRYDPPPATLVAPAGLVELEPDEPGLWADQRIGNEEYLCYFVRRSRPDRRMVAFVKAPDAIEQARHCASLLALFSLIVAFPGLGLALAHWRKGRTLESRILVSYVFVSLVPIGGIAWLESGYAQEQLHRQLEQEADQLFAQLDRAAEVKPLGPQDVGTDWCLDMAQRLGTRISVFRQGSS